MADAAIPRIPEAGLRVSDADRHGTLRRLHNAVALGLIDGDFEVAHEGHPQQPEGQVSLGVDRHRYILRLDRSHADRLQGGDGGLDWAARGQERVLGQAFETSEA